MKQYIKELHSKPVHHKKRFALLASGAVTLIIFGFWSAISFSAPSKVAESTDGAVNLATAVAPLTPFEDILHGITSSWTGLANILSNVGK